MYSCGIELSYLNKDLSKCEISKDIVDCNNKFDNYQWIKELTQKGAFGYIYEVYNKKLSKQTILKVQPYGKEGLYTIVGLDDDESASSRADDEMKISCIVSDLPNFVKLIDYWICDIDPIDDVWKTSSFGEKRKTFDKVKKLYYIEMEKYDGTLRDLVENKTLLTEHDKFSIFFELTNALIYAFQQVSFSHGDIHLGNMFYKFNNEPRQYTLYIKQDNNNKTKKLTVNCNSIFYPSWGDFGKSSLKPYMRRDLYDNILDSLKLFNIDKTSYYFDSDNDFLEYLGEKVIKTENNKKQKIK